MPTGLQIKLIHVAYKQAGLNEPQYRNLLRNIGGVKSSLELDQSGFEDCMAVIEDSGFREREKAGDYWRRKVELRGQFASPRMVRKIEAMGETCRYELPSLCAHHSAGRAHRADQLHPREAWNLIEMLKAVEAREEAFSAKAQRREGEEN